MDHVSRLLTHYPWLGIPLRVLVIIAVVLVCAKLIHLISNRILAAARAMHGHTGEREKRLLTVVKLIDTSLRVVLYVAALLMVLRECGLDITPLLTGVGIAGLAFGFGAQSLVKDMISGFFILLEDQIRVGDVIKINGGLAGAVERMELRVTAIRGGDGTLHIIPNGEIKSVSNMTYNFSQAVIEIPVPYRTDVRKLSEVLTAVARELDADTDWKADLKGRPEFIGVTKFEPAHMTVELSVRTEPHSQWKVARELRRRAKLALDRASIDLSGGVAATPQIAKG